MWGANRKQICSRLVQSAFQQNFRPESSAKLTGNCNWKPSGNMKKSIRQVAAELNVSHTALRAAIAELVAEHGQPIGESQGKGKPTFLSEAEQALLAKKFLVSHTPDFIYQTRPHETTGIVVHQATTALEVYQPEQITLTVQDSTVQLTQAIQSLDATLKQFVTNGQTLDAALLQNSAMKGAELGTQMAIAKVGAAVKSSESLELQLAKKLGLVPEDAPAA